MKRNPRIEWYRILLVYGICLLHSILQGGFRIPWIDCFLCACVNGFPFISGYYGIRFRPSKFFGLLLTGVWCAGVVWGLMRFVFDLPGGIGCQYWFLYAYLVLMLFAPMLENMRRNDVLLESAVPILFLVFVWNYLYEFKIVASLSPTRAPEGFGAYTFLSLIGCYVAGMFCRTLSIESWFIGKGRKALLFAMIGVLCATGWVKPLTYNSPFAVMLAASLFILFAPSPRTRTLQSKLGYACGMLGLFVAPSVFGIYLLHTNTLGYHAIHEIERVCMDYMHLPLKVTYLVTALIIFLVALSLDLLRRLVVWCLQKQITWLCGKIDAAYLVIVK